MANKFCENCGCSVMLTMRMCPECGAKSFSDVPKTSIKNSTPSSHSWPNSQGNTYAGFWERGAAFLIDYFILGIILFGFGILVGLSLNNNPDAVDKLTGFFTLVGYAGFLVYFALFESGINSSTLGKRFMGLQVLTTKNQRISINQGFGRQFGRILSTLTILIGYLMQPFTKKKQTLHDYMAGTIVVRKGSNLRSPAFTAAILLASLVLWTLFLIVIKTLD